MGATSDPDQVGLERRSGPLGGGPQAALAWRPDLRWPDAPNFHQAWVAPAGAASDIAAVPVPAPIARKRLGAGLLVALGLALPLLIAAVWGRRKARLSETVGTGDRLAILPLAVGGTDSSLGYLREGMVDLLAAKLSSSGGPSVVDAAGAIAGMASGRRHRTVRASRNGVASGGFSVECHPIRLRQRARSPQPTHHHAPTRFSWEWELPTGNSRRTCGQSRSTTQSSCRTAAEHRGG